MASIGKSVLKTGKKILTRKEKAGAVNKKHISMFKHPVKVVLPNMPVVKQKLSTAMIKEIEKEFDFFRKPLQNPKPESLLGDLDVSLESFFYKRDFSLENFNLLLQILSQKGKIDESLGIIDKMKILGIMPNQKSYIYLITASGRAKDPSTSELIFSKAKRDLEEVTSVLYTALISSYTHSGDHEKILQLMNEKVDKGFVRSAVDYTCYMNSLVKSDLAEKALEIFDAVRPEVDVDEYMLAMAIHACTKTNDAELALRLWGQLKGHGFAPLAYFYNEIIMALAKRQDYAEQALEVFREMRGAMVRPDERTYNAVLTACSRRGDLPEARLALRDMKEFGIEMDKVRYGLLLSVYAGSCFDANEMAKEVFVKEAWEIFRLCEERGWVDTLVVNSLLSVHTKAYFDKQVEGLIIPLFKQYGLAKDKHTYRHLFRMYSELAEYKTIHSLWDAMKQEGVKPDMYILNDYLKSTILTRNTDRAAEALESFKENEYKPLYAYMKRMHRAEKMPLRLWALLQEFKSFYTPYVNKEYTKRIRFTKDEERFTK